MAKGKPNTSRLLVAAGISHQLVEYTVDENLDAKTVSVKIGADIRQVFKTLVARGDRTGVCVFCLPGDGALDLKRAAKLTGNKRVEMVRSDELRGLTGYIRGGCSPIGMKKRYPTFFDESVLLFESVYVSAGVRGQQIQVDPKALVPYVGAKVAKLIRRPGTEEQI